MKERTALGEAILKHWREHCPQMVRELEKSRGLNRAVFEAQERTGDLLHELTVVRRMDYQAAWELAAKEWALPEETRSKKPEAGHQKSEKSKPKERKAKAKKSQDPKAGRQKSGASTSGTSRRSRKPRSRRGTSG